MNNYEKIIRKELEYFLNNSGFCLQYEWETPKRKIYLKKNKTYILFEEFPQFKEKYTYIHNGVFIKEINIFEIIKELSINKTYSDKEYWRIIGEHLNNYINEGTAILGEIKQN